VGPSPTPGSPSGSPDTSDFSPTRPMAGDPPAPRPEAHGVADPAPGWEVPPLIDQSGQPFVAVDFDGRLLHCNRAFLDLLGYSRAELFARSLAEITPERWRPTSTSALARLKAGGRPERYEKEYFRKDGSAVPVDLVANGYRDPDGVLLGVCAFVTDVSARKQAEADLIASERRSRVLFEGIEDAVFVHDLDGRILDANAAACRRLGYDRDEILRLTTRDIDDPEFASGFEDRLRRQVELGRLSFEGRHRAKDGRVIPVDINTSLIQYGGQTAVLAVMRDITERKALEATRHQFAEAQMGYAREVEEKNRALSRSERRYRQLTEGCLDAIVLADMAGNITLFNPAAERTFGYLAGEVVGRPLTALMPEESREAHNHGLRRYLETRDPRIVGRTVSLTGRRKTGEVFPLELSLSAVEIAGEVQFVGAIRDQTERQRMQAMLAQTEKLASIGLLSAGVAHEINNPLAYVGNNLAILERDLKGVAAMMAAYEGAHDRLASSAPEVLERVLAISDELDWPYVRENLDRILSRTREGVQRVAHIVQNLRGLARTSPPQLEETLLTDVMASALELVQGRTRRRNIELTVDAAPGLPKISCVSSQIGQVLLNLLVNAIQAVESTRGAEGGKITVSVRACGDYQAIDVADNGGGIAEEDLPHLFDPFFTTKPQGEGTGLGLSISHGIVSGHGGRIEVETRPGEGALFRVLLPVHARYSPGGATARAPSAPTTPGPS
jgi:two-component system, NtrC family, sensor kinase